MNRNLFKGYFLTIASGLVLTAGIVLVFLQWGNLCNFSLYGKNVQPNTMALMLASAIGGIVAVYLFKALFRGIKALRSGRQQQAIQDLTDQARQQNQPK